MTKETEFRSIMRSDYHIGAPRSWGYSHYRFVCSTRTRTKEEYPYSYDEYFLIGDTHNTEGAEALYSDRIWQWDHDLSEHLWKRHVGKRWPQASSEELSAFLSERLARKVRVVAVAEGCNASSGYPYWIVWFKQTEPTSALPNPPANKDG